jgi:hypothetical protein
MLYTLFIFDSTHRVCRRTHARANASNGRGRNQEVFLCAYRREPARLRPGDRRGRAEVFFA